MVNSKIIVHLLLDGHGAGPKVCVIYNRMSYNPHRGMVQLRSYGPLVWTVAFFARELKYGPLFCLSFMML